VAELADHVGINRRVWDGFAATYAERAPIAWAKLEPEWGVWDVPESDLHVLPGDLRGQDVVELGCGTAYVSAWLARRGARPVGVDLSWEQLSTARRMQAEFGLRFPLVHANAEAVPLRNASFDLAISEYGASIWCDPYRWIPESARLLRPGGELIFLVNGTLLVLCAADTEAEGAAGEELRRAYFGMHRFEWPDSDEIEFHLGYGDWIRLLRANGFEVTDLIEIRAPDDTGGAPWFVSRAWARRWPSEQVWKATKLG